jgi:L-ascorbate metabolism protein UlaG (beta-lactamase superfamily)
MNRRRFIQFGLAGLAALGLGGGYTSMANPHYSGPVSDHFDGTRFFIKGHNGDKGFGDMLKWSFGGGRAKWPAEAPSKFNHAPPARVEKIRSTLIGHASYLLQINGHNILIDPVYVDRASPFQFAGPKRVNAPGIAFDDLPPIDAVLVTHNHYDHLDKETLWRIEERHRPRFIMPLGVDGNVARGGRKPAQTTVLDWGQHTMIGPVSVHAVPAYHWSARGLGDRRKTLWCSFVITSPAGAVYHIGDTGYGAGVFSKQVARDFGRIDLAHIPIGAYEPRWFMQQQHVNPAEAVQVFQDCGAAQAIGHHWGTFQLTNEAIDEPPRALAEALALAAIAPLRFRPFRPGQAVEI